MAAALAWAARIVERWYPKERWAFGERLVRRTASRDRNTAPRSVTVSPAAANRPSEWARNPAATRVAAKTRLSPSTRRRRSSRVTPTRVRPLPAQLPQPGIVDAEVVGNLVDDGAAHLLHDLLLAMGDGADRAPIDGDPVGHGARVADPSRRQRHAWVEPEQSGLGGHVLHEHRHVVDVLAQLLGNPVEGVGHQLFEALPRDVDHPATLCG